MSTPLTLTPYDVSPDQLLLDPNNYRFHDIPGYKFVANKARFAEEAVQERALKLLQETEAFSLASLRESILANGFVPVEQIVVERFGDDEQGRPRFIVVEGNRRVATIKILLRDQAGGSLDAEQPILNTFATLPVVELQGTQEERGKYQQTLMAIRHVGGIKAWGAYQQAKLVVEMYEDGLFSFSTVAQKIGIPAREVGRRYRASKALQQMEEDEEFGQYAEPKLYATFQEIISQPKVRTWLDFTDETFSAESEDARNLLYELLSPREVDDKDLPPKLDVNITDVRKLKDIVDKAGPLEILADPTRSFDDAIRAARDETVADEPGALEHALSTALNALRRPGIDAWTEPSDRAKQLWDDVQRFITTVNRLMGTS